MDNNTEVPQEIKKIEMPHESVISFLSYYPQGMKRSTSKFTVAKIRDIVHNSQDMETTSVHKEMTG